MPYILNDALRDEIYELLEKARLSDTKLNRFGASTHKYALGAPVPEAEIKRIEEAYRFVFPEDHLWFLTNVGNGGAGPDHGLYDIRDKRCEYQAAYLPSRIPTEEDGERLAEIEDDALSDKAYDEFFAGMIIIGTKGCSLDTALVVNGEHCGKIVDIDHDFHPPARLPVALENNTFIDWYMGWLKEAAAGYIIHSYGYTTMGSLDDILCMVLNENDPEAKLRHIRSMKKCRGVYDRDFSVPSSAERTVLSQNISEKLCQIAQQDEALAPEICNVLMYYGAEGWKTLAFSIVERFGIRECADILRPLYNESYYKLNPGSDEAKAWFRLALQALERLAPSVQTITELYSYNVIVRFLGSYKGFSFDTIRNAYQNGSLIAKGVLLDTFAKTKLSSEAQDTMIEYINDNLRLYLESGPNGDRYPQHLLTALNLAKNAVKFNGSRCRKRFAKELAPLLYQLGKRPPVKDFNSADTYRATMRELALNI